MQKSPYTNLMMAMALKWAVIFAIGRAIRKSAEK